MPMEWSPLPDISETPPISDADTACLRELQAVLEKHDATGRFGLTLMHKHFDIAEDEMLVEFPDVESRTLVTKVMRQDSVPKNELTITSVSLANGKIIAGCRCAITSNGHGAYHQMFVEK